MDPESNKQRREFFRAIRTANPSVHEQDFPEQYVWSADDLSHIADKWIVCHLEFSKASTSTCPATVRFDKFLYMYACSIP